MVQFIFSVSHDVQTVLQTVFLENKMAAKAISSLLKQKPTWHENQREIFVDTMYFILRYWRLLWYLCDSKPRFDVPSIHQLLQATNFLKRNISTTNKHIPSTSFQFNQQLQYANNIRALRESIPDWLDTLGEQQTGKQWDTILPALNKPPTLFLRTNTLKISRSDLQTILRKEGAACKKIEWAPDALALYKPCNIFRFPSFAEGLFEVQDAASQMVSHLLDPQPGMRVVDACAGEGGKTLHLAALMKNKGKIIALDTQAWRLQELRRRAAKAGADTIETRLLGSSKTRKRLQGTADRLLLDVPCSGVGTLQRNPNIKWKLTETALYRLEKLQQELLEQYCVFLKVTGRFVYTTCSVFPLEGENQIQAFLSSHPGFTLIEEKRFWPQGHGTDGFYMALVQRNA